MNSDSNSMCRAFTDIIVYSVLFTNDLNEWQATCYSDYDGWNNGTGPIKSVSNHLARLLRRSTQ